MKFHITHEFDVRTQTLTVWVDYAGHLRLPREKDGQEAILAWRASQEARTYYAAEREAGEVAYQVGLRSPTCRSRHHGDFTVYQFSPIED